MTNINDLPIYDHQWTITPRVGAGLGAETVRLSPTIAFKFKSLRYGRINFVRTDPRAIEELAEEFIVTNQMYDEGIPVIKPEGKGVCQTPISTFWKPLTLWRPKYVAGLVMPYVDGKLIEQFPEDQQIALHERAGREILDVIYDKGFTQKTTRKFYFPSNTLVTPEGKLFFVGMSYFNPKK